MFRDHCIIKHSFKWQNNQFYSCTDTFLFQYYSSVYFWWMKSEKKARIVHLLDEVCMERLRERKRQTPTHSINRPKHSPWNEASFSLSVQSVCVTPSETGKMSGHLSKHRLFFYLKQRKHLFWNNLQLWSKLWNNSVLPDCLLCLPKAVFIW